MRVGMGGGRGWHEGGGVGGRVGGRVWGQGRPLTVYLGVGGCVCAFMQLCCCLPA